MYLNKPIPNSWKYDCIYKVFEFPREFSDLVSHKGRGDLRGHFGSVEAIRAEEQELQGFREVQIRGQDHQSDAVQREELQLNAIQLVLDFQRGEGDQQYQLPENDHSQREGGN